MADIDFGYGQQGNSNADVDNGSGNPDERTSLDTGKVDTGSATDITGSNTTNTNEGNNGGGTNANGEDKGNDNGSNSNIEPGTTIEVGDEKYTVDENLNIVDKDGNIFKEAKDVNDWLKGFDKVDNAENEISIDTIKNLIGVEITDDSNKPVEFENTPEGVKAYVDAVIETSRQEHYETAINTLYQKYPILNDVLNYYIANGNSLEGFGEVPDRSNIVVEDSNEQQQESIIRAAWKEQNRRGDVEGYIQYLKSSGTLLATAKEELAAMQEADKQYREELEQEAAAKEEERIKNLETYWNGVHDTIKSKKIAGYQIPDSIIINRDGQKISVTPEDFFNYIYRVDNEGKSAYERDLEKESLESRRDDQILRAYLKFTGGSYSNLVDMAINEEKVKTLRYKAKERNASTVRLTPPSGSKQNKAADIDFGYN